jgi:methionyl-tRNA formyltransferase
VLERTPQPTDGITYAHKIEKNEAAIDWALPAAVIERRVRAFDPFPGCTAQLQTDKGVEVLKVWGATVHEGQGEPGGVLHRDAHQLVIACGQGALSLSTVQRPGGKRVPVHSLLATWQNDWRLLQT